MKYGVILYKNTDNIGDDIQTYASLRFLPRVDYVIDREEIDSFVPEKNEKVNVILNGWYMHKKFHFPFSPYINPLMISIHFTKYGDIINQDYNFLDGYTKEYIIKHYDLPIGCRDESTLKILKEKGYKAYFSGCLTTTIKIDKTKKTKKYICVVDMNEKVLNKIKSTYPDYEIKTLSHWLNPDEYSKKSFEERMSNVVKLLEVYQDAELVITDRLHVSLPCLALNTKVLLIYDENTADRLSTYKEYVTNVSYEEFINMKKSDFDKIKNKDKYKRVRNKLIERVNLFINNKEITNKEKCPDILKFNDEIKRVRHSENLFINTIDKLKKENMELWDSCVYYQKTISEYEAQLEKIRCSRSYKVYKIIRKVYEKISFKKKEKNRFIIKKININENNVSFEYDIEGTNEFKNLFWMGEMFNYSTNYDISNVPKSILSIPLIGNVIPIIWVNDAELVIDELDKTFYNSLSCIKKEFKKMIKPLKFKGKITVNKIVDNYKDKKSNKNLILFSGGVDSYSTVLNHKDENNYLGTLWGADIDYENDLGWLNARNYIESESKKLKYNNVFVKASIRRFIDNSKLEEKYHEILDDNWWHSVQHGIGITSCFIPVMYKLGIGNLYVSSTYTNKEVCGANREIVESLKSSNINVIYDEGAGTRQEKIRQICENKNIRLRICYRSNIGSNCCNCEKCFRTIMGILAEGKGPNMYGLTYNEKIHAEMKKKLLSKNYISRTAKVFWREIINRFNENKENNEYKKYSWINKIDTR